MKALYTYDDTGRITGRLRADEATLALNAAHTNEPHLIAEHMDGEVYIRDGIPMLRPPNSARLVGSMLLDLPVPCTIAVNSMEYPCDEDHAEITFTQPGKYTIAVAAWPYLDKEFTYENPA